MRSLESGFTLVEVLISLIIFSIVITGVITVAAQGGLSVNQAKDKLVASYLADEGVETMRAFRDTTVLSASTPPAAETEAEEEAGWASFLATFPTECSASSPCDIDVTNAAGVATFPTTANFEPCAGECQIFYNATTGTYTDRPGPSTVTTLFSRSTQVTVVSSDEVHVEVTVSWIEGAASHQSVTDGEDLFNWY